MFAADGIGARLDALDEPKAELVFPLTAETEPDVHDVLDKFEDLSIGLL